MIHEDISTIYRNLIQNIYISYTAFTCLYVQYFILYNNF